MHNKIILLANMHWVLLGILETATLESVDNSKIIEKDITSRCDEKMSVSAKSSMKSLDMAWAYRRITGQWRTPLLSTVGFLRPVRSW